MNKQENRFVDVIVLETFCLSKERGVNDTGEVHKRWDLTSAPEVSEQLGNCAQR